MSPAISPVAPSPTLPLSSRRPSVSFGGFGLRPVPGLQHRLSAAAPDRPPLAGEVATFRIGELPAALQAVRKSTASPSVKLGLEMLALTACRSGEVRGMTWDEVNLREARWTIPGERMKAGKPHRVPLSSRAMGILGEARSLSEGNGLVFPAPHSGGVLSDMAFPQLLRRLDLDFVPHGLRSSFRDWAAEKTNASHAVMEKALLLS